MSYSMQNNSNLTPRQQRFADAYVLTGNASEAAREAGYSERTARQQGSRLLSNVAVSAAIAERQAVHAQELGVTKQAIIDQLQEAIQMGREQMRPDVLIAGAMGLARLCGLLEPQRVAAEVSVDLEAVSRRFAAMSDAELMTIAKAGRVLTPAS